MAAYNAKKYIGEAIQSVLSQSYEDFELIVIDDGSRDSTREEIMKFNDKRIRSFFRNENSGVSISRNIGLREMTGEYFCFLDSDDMMTSNSLTSRLKVFEKNTAIEFVGGSQVQKTYNLKRVIKNQVHDFQGNPYHALVRIDERCFINCGTWMIKRQRDKVYRFVEDMTHCEDLVFFLSISHSGLFDYTTEVAQIYRRTQSTAMSDLKGLEEGYQRFYNYILDDGLIDQKDLIFTKKRIARIMGLSYLSRYQLINAFNAYCRFIRL